MRSHVIARVRTDWLARGWLLVLLSALLLLAAAGPLRAQDEGGDAGFSAPDAGVSDTSAPAGDSVPSEPAVDAGSGSDAPYDDAQADAPYDDGFQTDDAVQDDSSQDPAADDRMASDTGDYENQFGSPDTNDAAGDFDPFLPQQDDRAGTDVSDDLASTDDRLLDDGSNPDNSEDQLVGAGTSDEESEPSTAGETGAFDDGFAGGSDEGSALGADELPQLGSATPDTLETPAPNTKPLTQDEARRVLRAMGNRSAQAGYTPDFTDDGCFWRAHLYEQEARSRGLEPERVHIVTGSTERDNSKWRYHTAVSLPVVGDDGVARRMVFDPAVSNDPVRMSAWSADLIPGERRYGDDAPVQPFTTPYSYVSVGPGSTSDPRNLYPAGLRPGSADGVLAAGEEGADSSYTSHYPDTQNGRMNPQRFVWRNDPDRQKPSKPKVASRGK